MPQHVVIIGAVALGPKAAARFKRLEPDSRVTMVDRDKLISYGGCGIPYYVSGDVNDAVELQKTAFHMVRDVEFFRATKGVDVRTETEALGIDRAAKTVTLRHLPTGREEVLAYDKLVLGTGSTPNALPVPGVQFEGIHAVSGLEAAQRIRELVSGGGVSRAVVVGAGFIGLELAVALADMWGVETTVVEFRDQILPGVLGGNLARMAQKHMEEKGVTFRLGEQVLAFEGGDQGRVARVVTQNAALESDLVIVAVGVRPNSELARSAGLAVSERGGIRVDEHLRTSDADIFAGGDCVELKHLITGSPAYLPLGSLANRQGRVIGTNLAGGASTFAGAVGSWCVKLFDLSAAGTGPYPRGGPSGGVRRPVRACEPAGPRAFLPGQGTHEPGTGGGALHGPGAGHAVPGRHGRRPGGPGGRGGGALALRPLGGNLERAGDGLFAALCRSAGHPERAGQRGRKHAGWAQPGYPRGRVRTALGWAQRPWAVYFGLPRAGQRRGPVGPLPGALAQYPPGRAARAAGRNPPGHGHRAGLQHRRALV